MTGFKKPKISMGRLNRREIALKSMKEQSNDSSPFPQSYIEDAINNRSKDRCVDILKKMSRSTQFACEYHTYIPALYDIIKEMTEANIITESALDSITVHMIMELCDNNEFKSKFYHTYEEVASMDRVIINNSKLAKRFNLDMVTRKPGCSAFVAAENMCSLIDTYDIPVDAKLNIALESGLYSLYKASKYNDVYGKEEYEKIYNSILEYFMDTNPVISDYRMKKIQSILENNDYIITPYFNSIINTMKSIGCGEVYGKAITECAALCENKTTADTIVKAPTVKNEKQGEQYINVILNRINKLDCTIDDQQYMMKSIFALPLIGNVSKAFVISEMQSKHHKFKDKLDKNLLETVHSLMESDVNDLIPDVEFVMEYTEKVVSESVPGSKGLGNMMVDNSIKKMCDEFRAGQDKSPNKFNALVRKIYTKQPEDIIMGVPNIFGVVRAVFIFGTATITIIGPVLAAILFIVDRLIYMEMNKDQSTKLLEKLRNEKRTVEKQIENGKDSENAKKYLETLDKAIEKVTVYRDSMTDDDEDDEIGDDPFDDDDDDLFGDSLEEASLLLTRMEMVNILFDLKESGIEDDICNNIDVVVSERVAREFVDTCSYLFDIITPTKLMDVMNKYKQHTESVLESSIVDGAIHMTFEDHFIEEDMDSLVMVYEAAMTITEAFDKKEDGEKKGKKFNPSTIKLILQNFKSKVKNLSTKEKSIWQTIDVYASGMANSIQKALTNDRREAIIKGSIIPSFSKCIKSAIAIGGATLINPVLGIIAAVGSFAVSKTLNYKEKRLIYDEIETELKVVEKEIQIAENDNDMKKYRCMLQYQRRLQREHDRIKYNIKSYGRDIPMDVYSAKRDD